MYSKCLGISYTISSQILTLRLAYSETNTGDGTTTYYYGEITNNSPTLKFSQSGASVILSKYQISTIISPATFKVNTFSTYTTKKYFGGYFKESSYTYTKDMIDLDG